MNELDIEKITKEFIRLTQPNITLHTGYDSQTVRLILPYRPRLVGLTTISDDLAGCDIDHFAIAKLLHDSICDKFEECQALCMFCHRWYIKFLMRLLRVKI